jgi:hypothetical protein
LTTEKNINEGFLQENCRYFCGKSQNTAPLIAVMKRELGVHEPTGVWGQNPDDAFSVKRYSTAGGEVLQF